MAFPADFLWGVSTAAYQIEGASDADGRGLGIWDRFTEAQQGGADRKTACDHYHLFKNDVSLMRQLGLRHYNFSISWPRVQPTGRGPTNQAGLDFYCQLVDCLVQQGIEPIVTLYHWDLPADLQAEFGGWASREIVPLFADYAREVFDVLGRRGVRRWVTLHEPWCIAVFGYGRGIHAPGVVSEDPATLYQVGHNLLLAHAEAVRIFCEELQLNSQGCRIGITLSTDWAEPAPAPDSKEHSELNAEAAERVLHCSIGWFAGPIYTGDYPTAMRSRCPDLPHFSPEESAWLRDSADFLCIWHHNVELIQAAIPKSEADVAQECEGTGKDASTWQAASVEIMKDPAWPLNDAGETQTPWALHKVLLWVQQHYKPRGGIIVMAPGFGSPDCSRQRAVDDTERVQFMHDYICAMRKAMSDGADVRGYFAWTLLDSFEWQSGYNLRYGLVHVDFATQKRTPKASARWYSRLIGQRAQLSREQDLVFCRSCRALPESEDGSLLWWAIDANNKPAKNVQVDPAPACGDTVQQALLALFQNASVEDEVHEAALAGLDPQSIFCTLEAIERHLQSCCERPSAPGALRPLTSEGLQQVGRQISSDLRDVHAVHGLATKGGYGLRSGVLLSGSGVAEGAPRRSQTVAACQRWQQAIDKATRWKARQLSQLWGFEPAAVAQYGELALVNTATLAAALLQQGLV